MSNSFLTQHAEKLLLNQYWYSQASIDALTQEIEYACHTFPNTSYRCAFLSTPSLYLSLPDTSQVKQESYLFDVSSHVVIQRHSSLSILSALVSQNFDPQWSHLEHFVHYDFKAPQLLPVALLASFDMVVIDPPFVTQEVWALYAQASHALLKPGGRVLLSTIPESSDFLNEYLQVHVCKWRPSIPNLIYQYCMFANYDSPAMSRYNPEIDPDEAQRDEQGNSTEHATTWTARKACSYPGFGSSATALS